jgi:hypothetical protein
MVQINLYYGHNVFSKYLASNFNILQYTLFNVTIISRRFMLIIILENTYNMVVHINSKYTFTNTLLYTHKVGTKLVTFATNGT